MFTRIDRMRVGGVACALVLALFAGCDDEPTGNTLPAPTLDNSWPNEDGRYWNYALTERDWIEAGVALYDSTSQVPPVTLDMAESLLAAAPPGDSIQVRSGTYQLQFDSLATTESGAQGQNLRETVTGPGPNAARTIAFDRTFLARLARARPDLADRLPAQVRAPVDRPAGGGIHGPMILHGYVWEKTAEHIGTYGDVDLELAWKFLGANLAVRSEFRFQLVPSLADDVFLSSRILRQTSVQTPAGTYNGALACLYLIDYGVSQAVSEDGTSLAYFRTFDYGTIHYVPHVGPVASYERRVGLPQDVLPDPGVPTAGDTRVDLTATALPVAAARRPSAD